MKSYLQGLIGGGVIVFTFFVLTGQKHGHHDTHGHHSMDDIMHKLEELEKNRKVSKLEYIVTMLINADSYKIS